MAKQKRLDMVIHSIRLPDRVWQIIRNLANRHYRTLNNQILKIVEDWLVDRGYLEDSERTRSD